MVSRTLCLFVIRGLILRLNRSDVSHSPVAPPSSFALPAPQTSLVPAPTPSDPDAQIKRNTVWQWVDSDWHVRPSSNSSIPIIASSAATIAVNASAPNTLPSNPAAFADWARARAAKASQSAQSSTSSATKLFAAHARGSSISLPVQESDAASSTMTSQAADFELSMSKAAALGDDQPKEDWIVDAQGWQYGDNSWEKLSQKAGIGRYTRRRAWERCARVIETTEQLSGQVTGLRKRTVE